MGDQLGTVKSWYDVKGFGFIVQEGGTGDIFVHYSSIMMGGRRHLNLGQRVRFRLERRDKGLTALDVEVVDEIGAAPRCHACGQELHR
jgi:CspA family cold shock protein